MNQLQQELDSLERETNIFERHPRIKKAIPLVERKIELENEWNSKEAGSLWFPAPKTSDKGAFSLEIFSKRSVLLMLLLALFLFPIPVLLFPLYKTFKNRRAKIEELKAIEKEIKGILPAKFCEERGDYVPSRYKHLVPYFYDNGIFFKRAGRDILEQI